MNFSDETLMAYVDGELDAKLRAQIDAAVSKDPELAGRLEKHRALRARVSGAYAKVLAQPVSDRLVQAARGAARSESAANDSNVLKFPARASRPPAAPWRAREWAAMAASLVLGALISWRMFGPDGGESIVAGKDALVARGDLARALDAQLASQQGGEEAVMIGLTFKARDGNYCRSFVMRATATAGLACRAGSDWQVAATDAVVLTPGAVQQAASAVSPAILRAIETRGDGAILDAEAEKSAQLSGWKPASAN